MGASPAGLTETDRSSGVIPLLGFTNSQLPLSVVETAVERLSAGPVLLDTVTLCAAGAGAPWEYVNATGAGEAVSIWGLITFSVTVTS